MNRSDPGRKLKTIETTVKLFNILKQGNAYDLTTIAEELNLAKSTVHGYLKTLENYDYVYEDNGHYHIGAELLTLGGHVRYRRPSYSLIIQKVNEVSDHTSERAQFVIEEGRKCVHLHVPKGSQGVEADSRIGKRSYMHASAAGKSILAHSSVEMVDQVVDKWGLPAINDNTITDRDTFDECLAEVRKRGYAYNIEESISGLRSVGVPICNDETVIGAISVSGPSHRLTGEDFQENIPKFLLGISNELELRISYNDGI